MKFHFAADPNAEGYEVEITGLAPGTEAQMAISAMNSAGTGPQAIVPLVVPAPAPMLPVAPLVVANDDAERASEATEAGDAS
jgi:hypothetical protein